MVLVRRGDNAGTVWKSSRRTVTREDHASTRRTECLPALMRPLASRVRTACFTTAWPMPRETSRRGPVLVRVPRETVGAAGRGSHSSHSSFPAFGATCRSGRAIRQLSAVDFVVGGTRPDSKPATWEHFCCLVSATPLRKNKEDQRTVCTGVTE